MYITAAVYIVLHVSYKPLCRHPTKYPLVSGIFSCCYQVGRDRLVPLAATCCLGLPVSRCLDPSSRKQLKKKLAFVIPILDKKRYPAQVCTLIPRSILQPPRWGLSQAQGSALSKLWEHCREKQPGPLLHHMHRTVSTLEQNKCYNPGEAEGAQVHTQPSPAKLT